MLIKKVVVSLFALSFVTAAQAATHVYHGTLVSRSQCADNNASIFAKEYGCKKLSLPSKACAVGLTLGANGYSAVEVEIPALAQTGDLRKTNLSARLQGPYIYTSEFNAYSVTFKNLFQKFGSAEIKVASPSGALLAVNVYVDHQISENRRDYKQYECRNLKLVEQR
ncbi:hypothetical protein QJS83_01225 [Bdellovibrio sp. 22V]|uniref:hypothetical protein n=1 Tax=Bdellovibrio TaxID=958 RepID=UPI0025429DF5|nr:hypothetical protein [Bdellovibrio sp. 22V]WII72489.1 hypothetical protein QJS83_01225 [Bdellovibrio sp. 22V]